MRVLLATLLALAGCHRSTRVVVDVEGPPLQKLEMRVAVEGLAVPAAQVLDAPALPGRLVIVTPDESRKVTVTVIGSLVGGGTLETSGSVVTEPRQDVPLRLVLGEAPDGGTTDGGAATDMRPPSYSSLELVAGALGGGGALDGTGNAARFFRPLALAYAAGHIYVADTQMSIIRDVDTATGAVTTMAGMVRQTGGTNGTGTAARFNQPRGILADGAGNLYVADTNNHTIRKIVIATRAVTTFAGATGQIGSTNAVGNAARFNKPHGLALDSVNNLLFVADTRNHIIRQIDIATVTVSTLAGTAGATGSTNGQGAAARFQGPHSVAFTGGVVYVTDFRNSTIRAIDNLGNVTTFAGTPGVEGTTDGTGAAARFDGPQGLASDGTNLYVADSQTLLMRKITISGAVVTRLAGNAGGAAQPTTVDGTGTAARFATPFGVVFDGTDLWVGERDGHTLRKVVVASGAVTTPFGKAPQAARVDGTGTVARFGRPHGMAADGAGNLYVADSYLGMIRRVDIATGAVTSVAGKGFSDDTNGVGSAAGFRQPTALALDGLGNLWVADRSNNEVRKIVLATQTVSTAAGNSNIGGDYADGTGGAAHFNSPLGIAADSAGNVYVADGNNHVIRKLVAATGVVTTIAGQPGSLGSTDGTGMAARFNVPMGLALDGVGNLYIAEREGDKIRRLTLSTLAVTTVIPGSGGLQKPHELVYDRGVLYVADTGNQVVRRIALDGPTPAMTILAGQSGRTEVLPGPLPASINSPSGLAVGSDGLLYVASTRENAILRIR